MQSSLLTNFQTLIEKRGLASILQKGSSKEKEIKTLQKVLYEFGFGKQLNWERYGADGKYGGSTIAAVRAFAVENDLHLTNEGNEVTLKLAKVILAKFKETKPLDSALLKKINTLVEKPALASILKKKSKKKNDIKVLQNALNILGFGKQLNWAKYADDGQYGNSTVAAVRAFAIQNNLHLSGNGIRVTLKLAKHMLLEAEKAVNIDLLFQLGYGRLLNGERYRDPEIDFVAAEKVFFKKIWPKDFNIKFASIRAQYEMAEALFILKEIKNKKGNSKVSMSSQIEALKTTLRYLPLSKELKKETKKAIKDLSGPNQKAAIFELSKTLIKEELFKHLRTGPDWPVKKVVEVVEKIEVIKLGARDKGVKRTKIKQILQAYHQRIPNDIRTKKQKEKKLPAHYKVEKERNDMRHGDIFQKKWVRLKSAKGNQVAKLQSLLIDIGVLPSVINHGLFEYTTLAAVRMFQEYLCSYHNSKIKPTGIVDQVTWNQIIKWQSENRKFEHWLQKGKSKEYNSWLETLKKIQTTLQKEYDAGSIETTYPGYMVNSVNTAVKALTKKKRKTGTIRLKDWTFNEKEVHLIGIRRKENTDGSARKNDDLFILLINGMVFKFWGSTDSYYYGRKGKNGAPDGEAFLSIGQHKYALGWHNRGRKNMAKLYPGLNPYRGVLVFRDRNADKKFNRKDVDLGIDRSPNGTINIHWTGKGHTKTWSQGCQVIAGRSYIDPSGKFRDFKNFTANGSAGLMSNSETKIKQTKGAYNVFHDLLLLFRNPKVYHIKYTLLGEEVFSKYPKVKKILGTTLKKFKL